MKILFKKFLVVVFIIFIISCKKEKTEGGSKESTRHQFLALGTLCQIKINSDNIEDVKSYIASLESMFSGSISSSDVSLINKNAGFKPVKVHEDVIYVLEKAIAISKNTKGSFNPLVGCFTTLYRDESLNFCIEPEEEEIERLKSEDLLNLDDIVIDREKSQVFLKKKGECLDLGGIAKGYIVDQTAKFLESKGFTEFIINFGGDVLVRGDRLYNIGIQDPESKDNLEYKSPIRVEEVKNSSLVTSGAYQRNFTNEDGKFFHHIIDPETGWPSKIEAKSVSVEFQDTLIADAVSTAVFVDNSLKGSLEKLYPSMNIILLD